MTLLKDNELASLVTGDQKIVGTLPPNSPAADDATWYTKDSNIQAASLDLHIGAIYVPGVGKDDVGSVAKPRDDFSLKFGHTVVVTTHETIDLPNNLAAIGFPPSRLSFRGLLMTNPGHVDPGYDGVLRFAIMNVGKEEINLRVGDPIVTLLLFQLANGGAKKGWKDRRGATAATLTQDEVNRLSLDFLDVTSRSKEAAKKEVARADFRAKCWAPAITAIAAFIIGFFGVWRPLGQVENEVKDIQDVLKMEEHKSRLDEFEGNQAMQDKVDELGKKVEALLKAQVGENEAES